MGSTCGSGIPGWIAIHGEAATVDALFPWACYGALRFTASRIHAFHLAELGEDRLAWKDWSRYRDRLRALREMGEGGFAQLLAA